MVSCIYVTITESRLKRRARKGQGVFGQQFPNRWNTDAGGRFPVPPHSLQCLVSDQAAALTAPPCSCCTVHLLNLIPVPRRCGGRPVLSQCEDGMRTGHRKHGERQNDPGTGKEEMEHSRAGEMEREKAERKKKRKGEESDSK